MNTTLVKVVLFGLVANSWIAFSQNPAVTHNTWSSGTAMATAVWGPAVGVLEGQIYVVGGYNASLNPSIRGDTQIYNPATNSWSAGAPLPTPVFLASAAVVKNVLYVIGGATGTAPGAVTDVVWAYNPKTKTWSSKAPIPMARSQASAVVENSIIYVMGGTNGGQTFNDVESYNPATDTWTQETPIPAADSLPIAYAAGRMGTRLTGFTIVITGGGSPGEIWAGTEGYNAFTNTWTALADDPTPRFGQCGGSTGTRLYVAGGYNGTGVLTVTEAFKLSKNAWKTLAPMPTAAVLGGSAVYKGLLYCIGGLDVNRFPLSTVQIYQP